MIKAIIFDLDETLYDETQFVKGGLKAVARYIAKSKKALQNEVYELLQQALTEYGRGKVFDIVLGQLGLYREDLVSTLVKVYRTHKPKLTLYPEVRPVLSVLRKKNYLLGLITDGNVGVQQYKVEALDVKGFFECMIFSDEYGADKQKPNVFPYQKALEKLAVNPNEAIYIGDDPHKDFITAKKIGMSTARIMRGQHRMVTLNKKYEADFRLEKLSDIFEVLDWEKNDEKNCLY